MSNDKETNTHMIRFDRFEFAGVEHDVCVRIRDNKLSVVLTASMRNRGEAKCTEWVDIPEFTFGTVRKKAARQKRDLETDVGKLVDAIQGVGITIEQLVEQARAGKADTQWILDAMQNAGSGRIEWPRSTDSNLEVDDSKIKELAVQGMAEHLGITVGELRKLASVILGDGTQE